jgi:hypothetical protein
MGATPRGVHDLTRRHYRCAQDVCAIADSASRQDARGPPPLTRSLFSVLTLSDTYVAASAMPSSPARCSMTCATWISGSRIASADRLRSAPREAAGPYRDHGRLCRSAIATVNLSKSLFYRCFSDRQETRWRAPGRDLATKATEVLPMKSNRGASDDYHITI